VTTTEQTPEAGRSRSTDPATAQLDLRSLVTITREHPGDSQQRQVMVRIDNGPTSALMFGDRITVEVTPGSHVLRVNNTLFWKRVPYTIEPGEHLEFTVINRAGRLTLGFLAVMGVAPLYLAIERRSVR
jgi:Flp pilus assembly protein TadG